MKTKLPVSQKFYRSLTATVTAAVADFTAAVSADKSGMIVSADSVIAAIDTYILVGTVPSGKNRIVTLIFRLLQPEIDKALIRSASARLRAAFRKSPKTAPAKNAPTAPAKTSTTQPSKSTPFENQYSTTPTPSTDGESSPRLDRTSSSPDRQPSPSILSRRDRRAAARRIRPKSRLKRLH